MRVIVDTNVLVSSVLAKDGLPAMVLRLLRTKQFEAGTTAALLDELRTVLARPAIEGRIAPESTVSLYDDLATFIEIATPVEISGVFEDIADHRLLEACVAFQADYLVSGDRAVLALGVFQGTEIVNPAQFVALFSGGARA